MSNLSQLKHDLQPLWIPTATSSANTMNTSVILQPLPSKDYTQQSQTSIPLWLQNGCLSKSISYKRPTSLSLWSVPTTLKKK
eukprot:7385336-Ditylum_brightwellii.AAC.1